MSNGQPYGEREERELAAEMRRTDVPTPQDRADLDPAVRQEIVQVLCSQALADHLGDVRDAERRLWRLLGVDRPVYDHNSAWRNTRTSLRTHGIALPAHLEDDEDDTDDR